MAWEYAEARKANLNMQNFGTLEHSNWIRQILWSQLFSAFLFLLWWKEATIFCYDVSYCMGAVPLYSNSLYLWVTGCKRVMDTVSHELVRN